MSRHRRMGPERPFAVVMLFAAVAVVAGRFWLTPNPGTGDMIALGAAAAFGLLCVWGAVELWRMGKDR